MTSHKSSRLHARRYILTGLLTLIPLWVTWLVFNFVLNQLIKIGQPWVYVFSRQVEQSYPAVATWLLEPWFQLLLAVLFTLTILYLVGWATTRVVGKRMIVMAESLLERIPFIKTIYGATRKMLSALQQKPERGERVVLINFPSSEMRVVGFVTSTFVDETTGQELAAVYVPTTPNPTSGFVEILPVDNLIVTNWTVDEALSFIVTAGAVAPPTATYNAYTSPGAGKEGLRERR